MKKLIKNLLIVIMILISITAITIASINISNNRNGADNIKNKYISFMGDSITTYSDWSNNTAYNTTIKDNAVWYTEDIMDSVDKTWWKKTINDLNLKLCVNNSWSGSMVSITGGDIPAATMDRSYNLHNDVDNINPDIIVIYIGINDFNAGVELGSFSDVSEIYDSATNSYIGNLNEFAHSYATMLHKIKTTYENADVFCCTMYNNGNDAIKNWNITINNIAEYFDYKIVDFYNDTKFTGSNLLKYTVDYLHPNENGMNEMSKCLSKALLKHYK